MTATRGKPEKVHFQSPPAAIPGLVGSDGVLTDSCMTPAPSEPGIEPAVPRLKERLSPVLNLQPVGLNMVRQWGATVALAVWVLYASSGSELGIMAAAALVAAGIFGGLVTRRIGRGAVAQRGGTALTILVFLAATGFAGLAGATLLSPAVLVLPALVWTLAATGPRSWMVTLGARGAVLATAGIAALSASRFSSDPTPLFATVVVGATLVVGILVAGWHGRQAGPRLLQNTLAEAGDVDSLNAVNPLDAVRVEIAGQSDPAGIAAAAARAIDRQLRPSYVAVVERVSDGSMFVPLSEIVNDPNLAGLGRRLAGMTDSALSKGSALWMLDETDDAFTVTCRRMGIHAALIVPLEHLSRRIGAIQIAWTEALGPTTLADALSFSSEIARWVTPDLAIAQFSSEIERGYFDAIASLAAHVDDRDEFTRGHSRRVARHALTIAEVLNLDEDQQRKLLFAAELHDIGRIGVSDDILSKPGALTPDEWAQVRSYPRISADVVEPLSFFTDVREVVLYQNERWDGKGYPDKISGMEIPVLSRILAVADAYDAMTSSRAYRSAMSPRMALTELWKARGTRYDPEIVEAFVMHGNMRSKVA